MRIAGARALCSVRLVPTLCRVAKLAPAWRPRPATVRSFAGTPARAARPDEPNASRISGEQAGDAAELELEPDGARGDDAGGGAKKHASAAAAPGDRLE